MCSYTLIQVPWITNICHLKLLTLLTVYHCSLKRCCSRSVFVEIYHKNIIYIVLLVHAQNQRFNLCILSCVFTRSCNLVSTTIFCNFLNVSNFPTSSFQKWSNPPHWILSVFVCSCRALQRPLPILTGIFFGPKIATLDSSGQHILYETHMQTQNNKREKSWEKTL